LRCELYIVHGREVSRGVLYGEEPLAAFPTRYVPNPSLLHDLEVGRQLLGHVHITPDTSIFVVVAGVDEAGRGPVVGPMVLAIVAGDGEALKALGVRDSKTLSRSARERLYPLILKSAKCVNYVVVEPYVIDRWTASHKLNLLEAEEAAELIRLCDADVYYVDSPDPKPERFAQLLSRMAGRRIVAMNKAERIPQVAAASIVAKVVRDRLVDMLKAEMGDFGSGYPSDGRTIAALRASKIARECVRHSWSTSRRLRGGDLDGWMPT